MPKPNEPLFPETKDLKALAEDIWVDVQKASLKRNDPLRSPVLASINSEGKPSQRILVLREVLMKERGLIFHTDIRSEKVAELRQNAEVSLLFYHPKRQKQFRLTGTAAIHFQDDLWEQQWQKTGPGSLKVYLIKKKPGLPVHPSEWSDLIPPPDKRFEKADLEAGKVNFAVLKVLIQNMEYLYLAQSGHLRASWIVQNGNWQGQWLVP